jgi:hypothetical protein
MQGGPKLPTIAFNMRLLSFVESVRITHRLGAAASSFRKYLFLPQMLSGRASVQRARARRDRFVFQPLDAPILDSERLEELFDGFAEWRVSSL